MSRGGQRKPYEVFQEKYQGFSEKIYLFGKVIYTALAK